MWRLQKEHLISNRNKEIILIDNFRNKDPTAIKITVFFQVST
jgi:hypothetical protein